MTVFEGIMGFINFKSNWNVYKTNFEKGTIINILYIEYKTIFDSILFFMNTKQWTKT